VSIPHGLPSTPAQHQIAPSVVYFCNTSPCPNPAADRLRCCPGHQLSIPSVVVAPRSGPASLRTAADSDILLPAEACGSGHVSPAARYYWLLVVESHMIRRLFRATIGRIGLLSMPAGYGAPPTERISVSREAGGGKGVRRMGRRKALEFYGGTELAVPWPVEAPCTTNPTDN
jgi:hypothetical protein